MFAPASGDNGHYYRHHRGVEGRTYSRRRRERSRRRGLQTSSFLAPAPTVIPGPVPLVQPASVVLPPRQPTLSERVLSTVRNVPDFPKPGIMFKDITTLLADMQLTTEVIQHVAQTFLKPGHNITHVAGIESRGFIFGSMLALEMGVPFVMFRKPGKLPGETISASYEKEYGTDEIHVPSGSIGPGCRVLIVDDLIATGGTAVASADLVEKCGASIAAFAFIIELTALHGADKLTKWPVYVVARSNDE